MRGMNLITAILFYLTSMLPAWLFLILQIYNSNSQLYIELYDYHINLLLFLILLLFIVILILTKLLTLKLKKDAISSTKFNPSMITTINDNYVTFIITFTAPNLIVSINNDLITLFIVQLIFHLIIFLLYFNSSTIMPNIMLLFAKYQMYNFENKYWVLTKEKHLRNLKQDIVVKRIGDYLYIYLGGSQDK